MNRGVPPTPRNARTGEFTPPGIRFCAVENNCSDLLECCDIRLSIPVQSLRLEQVTQGGFAQTVILHRRSGFAARSEARLCLAVESSIRVWGYAPGTAFGPEALGQSPN